MTQGVHKGSWLLLLPGIPGDPDLPSVSESIYFHMWRTRQEPWTTLQDGDTVYVVDKDPLRIIWELRARHIRRTQYHSMDDALTAVRESFGLFPEDLGDYVLDRPTEGFFLGWATEVVGALNVPLPPEVNFSKLGARHGYLPWSRLPEAVKAALELPPPGRPAIAEPASWMVGDSALGAAAPPLGRYIPVGVRRAVWERDSGQCRRCGRSDTPLHFDHIWPVVKGGGNELANIQLLCQRHNLEKAARIVSEARRPAHADLVAALASELKFDGPRADLAGLVRAAVAVNRDPTAAAALLWELDRVSDVGPLRTAIEVLGHNTIEAALLSARLAAIIATAEPTAARELAAGLVDHSDIDVRGTAALALADANPNLDPDERRRLYTSAAGTGDPWVAGWGHIGIAGLEDDPGGTLSRHHLEQAANSTDPSPRSVAAFELANVANDEDEAKAWYRRALISPDPELFARCAVELAMLTGGKRACAYAAWALKADGEDVRALAHLVLGLRRCDDDELTHLREASRSPDAVVRSEALSALEELRPRGGVTYEGKGYLAGIG